MAGEETFTDGPVTAAPDRTPPTHRTESGSVLRPPDLAGLALVLLPWGAVMVWFGLGFREIRLADVPAFVHRALSLDLRDLGTLVHPFYPWGYPALLRAVATIVGDYYRAAQIIAITSAGLALVGTWVAARIAYGWRPALVATSLLAATYSFNEAALLASTDTPALAGLCLALAALAQYAAVSQRRWAFAAGIAIGGAYLMRYTAVVLLPVAVGLLAIRAIAHGRRAIGSAVFLIAGFAVAAAPQLIPAAIERGNPFWNRQDVNVHFGLLGTFDYGADWTLAQTESRGLAVIAIERPRELATHVARNVRRSVGLVDPLLLVLATVAMALLLVRRRGGILEGLWVMSGTAFAVATSLAFVNPRLLLPVLPPLVLIIAAGAARVDIAGRHARLLASSVILITGCGLAINCLSRLTTFTTPSHITSVSESLDRLGVEDPAVVLTLDHECYDMSGRAPTPFAHPFWSGTPVVDSPSAIRTLMRNIGARYLIATGNSPSSVPSLRGWWNPERLPADFVEVSRDRRGVGSWIWRLAPQQPPADWEPTAQAAWKRLASARSAKQLAEIRGHFDALFDSYFGYGPDNGTSAPLAPADATLDGIRSMLDAMAVFAACCEPGPSARQIVERLDWLGDWLTPDRLERYRRQRALGAPQLYRYLASLSDQSFQQLVGE